MIFIQSKPSIFVSVFPKLKLGLLLFFLCPFTFQSTKQNFQIIEPNQKWKLKIEGEEWNFAEFLVDPMSWLITRFWVENGNCKQRRRLRIFWPFGFRLFKWCRSSTKLQATHIFMFCTFGYLRIIGGTLSSKTLTGSWSSQRIRIRKEPAQPKSVQNTIKSTSNRTRQPWYCDSDTKEAIIRYVRPNYIKIHIYIAQVLTRSTLSIQLINKTT